MTDLRDIYILKRFSGLVFPMESDWLGDKCVVGDCNHGIASRLFVAVQREDVVKALCDSFFTIGFFVGSNASYNDFHGLISVYLLSCERSIV